MRRKVYTLDGTDRTNGEDFNLAASGGVLIEDAPADGAVEIAFDEDPDRFPVYEGRKIKRAFRKLRVYHASGVTGRLTIVTFQCEEDIDVAPPSFAGESGAQRTLDYSLALGTETVARHGDALAIPFVYGNRGTSTYLGGQDTTVRSKLQVNGVGHTFRRLRSRLCGALNPGAAAAARSQIIAKDVLCPQLDRPPVGVFDGASLPPTGYARVIATLACDAAGPLGIAAPEIEIGLAMILNRDSGLNNHDSSFVEGGFGIFLRQDGTWRVCSRVAPTGALAGGGPQYESAALTGLNAHGQFNTFEIRMYGATTDDDAYVEFWTNGQKALTLGWGAGTVLPVPSAIGNATGFMPALSYANDNYGVQAIPAPGLYVAGFRVIAGPTAASIED